MKKKTLTFLCSAISAVMVLVGCQGLANNQTNQGNDLLDKVAVSAAKAALELPETEIKSPEDFGLPKSSNGIKITWKSNNSNVITNDGVVTIPDGKGKTPVKLTATLSRGNIKDTKQFTVTVYHKSEAVSDKTLVMQAHKKLELSQRTVNSDEKLTLPNEQDGIAVTWKSNNSSIIEDDGTVHRPDGEGATEVTLTATLQKGSEKLEKQFTLTVFHKAKKTDDKTAIKIAKERLTIPTEIKKDGKIPLPAKIEDVSISWESKDTAVIAHDGTVVRPVGAGITQVTLTATLKKGAEEDTKDYIVTVYHKDEQNEKPAINLSNGGIAGTMQTPKAWDVDTIKWTKTDVAAGIYEYQFTASTAQAAWKVVVAKGNWNGGAYLDAVVNAGSKNTELQYDKMRGFGRNCETGGLEVGKTYKIVVTVKDGKVLARVEKVAGEQQEDQNDKPTIDLSYGGILGTVQRSKWDINDVKWTKKDVAAGIYEYQFTASTKLEFWKVAIVRGYWTRGTYLGAVVNAGSGDAELQYDNKLIVGGNCETDGLEVGKTYKIIVTVKDGKVLARVEKVAGEQQEDQNKKPTIDLSYGGILGTVQRSKWDIDNVIWTKKDVAAGIYEYQFTASTKLEFWKVAIVRGSRTRGTYLGAVVNAGSGDAELQYDNKVGTDGKCETDGLEVGKNYKIIVTVKDGKVLARVEKVAEEQQEDQNEKPVTDLSNGGIAGTIQTPTAWDVDAIKWTKADAAAGIYEYQFSASSEHASWKVVAGRGDWKSGTYLGAVVNAGSGDAELKYDNKVGVGVNCETGGLEVGKTYKIVVTVKDGKVLARVEKVAGEQQEDQNDKPAIDLSNGGIAGTMQQPKPWNVDAIKWTKADAAAGIYEYQFTASSEHASWKVVTVRGNWNSGAYLGAVVNAGSGDAELKYDNKSGVGVNCETGGLEVGKTYKIVVTVKDGKVFASVETM